MACIKKTIFGASELLFTRHNFVLYTWRRNLWVNIECMYIRKYFSTLTFLYVLVECPCVATGPYVSFTIPYIMQVFFFSLRTCKYTIPGNLKLYAGYTNKAPLWSIIQRFALRKTQQTCTTQLRLSIDFLPNTFDLSWYTPKTEQTAASHRYDNIPLNRNIHFSK
jgi:hypothetical protein